MWTELGKRQLSAWGITLEAAESFGLFEVADAATIYPDFSRGEPAIVIPYWWPNGDPQTFMRDGVELAFCRVRYLNPPVQRGFTKTKAQRYDQPARSGIHVYYPPDGRWSKVIGDPDEPIIITEGEAKAIVGALAGLPVIALGGVFNFALSSGEGLVEGLAITKWNGRQAFICFDSDRASNNGIMTAEARLVQELQSNRGALCSLIELPADGPNKVGLDDFLNKYGYDAFMLLLKNSISLGVVDAKVIALNKSCAWIEREGCVYDLDAREFVQKSDFTNGSKFSTVSHWAQGGKQRSSPKQVFIAPIWLRHPHAQRFNQIIFAPGDGSVLKDEFGHPALNMWNGWNAEYGATTDDPRIAAFLELTRYLFQYMEPEDRDYPLKLMAYKAQNPTKKIGKALVLVGKQGCGKSLWGECISAAFNPYSKNLASKAFNADFQDWMEKTVLAVINEAEAEHILQYGERLKSLITDLKCEMNVKFRPERTINSYTMYVLTANNRAVGSFSADDRRMVVIGCPPPMKDDKGRALYKYLGVDSGGWFPANGPAALMGYLLDLDLEGWTPPYDPPVTAEKIAAHREGLSPVQELAHQMGTSQGENGVEQLLMAATAWADASINSANPSLAQAAQATMQGLKNLQIRPWYTPIELSLIFPYIATQLMNSKHDHRSTPGLLAKELRNSGVDYLRSRDDPRGFWWRGKFEQFLLVSDADDFRLGLTQADFERYMAQFRTFGQRRR